MRQFYKYFLLFALAFVTIDSLAQSNQWQDIYEVKKKDTIYGISRAYGITIEELMDANPEMKAPDYKLKKGSKIFIPNAKAKAPTNTVVKKKMKTQPRQTLRVGVMLPLHDNDGDGKRMVEYYRGLLMGCDSLRTKGINTEVHAWNVAADADIRVTLQNQGVKDLDIIFGPLYTKQVKDLADFCRQNEIKLVIPFSIYAGDVQTNPQVYQVYQNGNLLAENSVNAFLERFPDCNPVIIDCNDTTSTKGVFTFGLRKKLEERGVRYQITNLRSSEENFRKAFSATKRNVVILNTGRSPELNLVFRRLNEMKVTAPNLKISMFGYVDWMLYEPTYRELFHKYDAYIPATYYYNKTLTRISQLEANYKRWFNVSMQQQYIPRFAVTGYDHAQFFLRGLFEQGSDFTGENSKYNAVQTPLRFQHIPGGGMQNNVFQLVHYKSDKVIETIAY